MPNLYKAEYYTSFKEDARHCSVYSVVSAENYAEAESLAREHISLIKMHPSITAMPIFVEARELETRFGIEDFVDSSFIVR